MDKFWVEAEKVLKPGGTVAIWTRCKFRRATISLFQMLTTGQHHHIAVCFNSQDFVILSS